jgi:exopolysaccharide biosynthesis WecB/TagA/CpsF family protein
MSKVKQENADPITREQVLGVRFFNGTANKALDYFMQVGGYMVAPVSPGLIKLKYDKEYRRALQEADVVLADSAFLVILWRLATGRVLSKISGVAYLKNLLESGVMEDSANSFWVVRSDAAKEKAIKWFGEHGFNATEDQFHVTPPQEATSGRYALLQEIETRRPQNIVVAIGGGVQEKLALYLRDFLLYRPRIHCVGGALGFLTGDEHAMPQWVDRFYLGWLWRLLSEPWLSINRLWTAHELPAMVFRYRSEMPPLRAHWSDL